jgi:uncharacterized membrane protein
MATGYGQGYPAYPGPVRREVRFDAINEAWDLFRQEMGTWILAVLVALALITVVTIFCFAALALAGAVAIGTLPAIDTGEAAMGVLVGYAFVGVIMWAVTAYATCGLLHLAIKQVRGQPISVSDLFGVASSLPSTMLTLLIVGMATGIAGIFCYVPGLIVAGLLMLALPLVVDARYSPTQACSASWDALKQDWLKAACFNFVLSLVVSVGALACGIGLLFTVPLFYLAIAIVYRDFFLTQPASYTAGPPIASFVTPPGSAGGVPPRQSPVQQPSDFLIDEPPSPRPSDTGQP